MIKGNLNKHSSFPAAVRRTIQGCPVTVVPGIHLRTILEENPNKPDSSISITEATATRYSHRGPLGGRTAEPLLPAKRHVIGSNYYGPEYLYLFRTQ